MKTSMNNDVFSVTSTADSLRTQSHFHFQQNLWPTLLSQFMKELNFIGDLQVTYMRVQIYEWLTVENIRNRDENIRFNEVLNISTSVNCLWL